MGSDRGGGTFLNTNKLLLTLGGREQYILILSFFLYEYTWDLEKSCWGKNNTI